MKIAKFKMFPAFKAEQCCYKRSSALSKDALKSLSAYSNDEDFAKCYLSWEHGILFFKVVANVVVKDCSLNYRKSVSIELFIGTRASIQIDEYCHHFLFFPKKVSNFHGREITKFTNMQLRPLINPDNIDVNVTLKPNNFSLEVALDHLFEFNNGHIFFSYRINRYEEPAQFYSNNYRLEKDPSLWEKMLLV